ncbi:MAG: S8 family serine peptidase [Hamadaea sp.]|uniref:S8 family peptidase n=1 Tax=Hamadaea sp. TaxID=2024425 RepID=UPI0017DEF5FB|nr:S8 family serine peptidase [Hamadaea sp.]NUT21745.1 S8 family serine peptidase [Hamadaea sp.]
MHRRRWAGVVAGGILAAMLAVPSGGAVAASAPAAGVAGAIPTMPTAAHTTITLVTGDKVTLTGVDQVSVERDPARTGITFTTIRRPDGHILIIPSDAAPLLAAGQVDLRLFDVTELARQEAGESVPLLVAYQGKESDTTAKLKRAGATVTRRIPGARTLAVRGTGVKLWRQVTGTRGLATGVTGLWLDARLHVTLDVSVPQIGAPTAWAAGYDGTGVTIGIVDTGVDWSHIDLWGQVIQARTFVGGSEYGDTVGHGTHVASTMVGSGVGSGGSYKGVAPGAKLLVAKVCLAADNCPTSAILEGMEWVASAGAKVVNVSLGGSPTNGIDPMEAAVESLTTQYGTLFVIAAGNTGAEEAVGSPATAPSALAVGAVDKSNNLASFSSRGPNPDGYTIKPEITAPGVGIVAAASPSGPNASSTYVSMSGTSMATPHVTGSAALLAQQHPQWTGTQLKGALVGAALRNPAIAVAAQGAGRVDVARVIAQSVQADPPTVTFGTPDDGTALTRTITYRNLGSTPETLSLDVAAENPQRGLAPDGMFQLSATSVTVPANGSASVVLTANPALGTMDGFYSGRILAHGADDTRVTTPFGLHRVGEAHTLTLSHLDRTGAQAAYYTTLVLDTFGRVHFVATNTPGTLTVRLPKDVYLVATNIFTGAGNSETTILRVPRFSLDGDTSLVMDARLGQPVNITVPDTAARKYLTEVSGQLELTDGRVLALGSVAWTPTVYSGLVRDDPTIGAYRVKVAAHLYHPGPDGTELNAPTIYHLAWFDLGAWPVGFTRTVAAGSLATVESRYAAQVAGSTGYSTTFPQPSQTGFQVSFGYGMPMTLPFTRDEVFNADGGVKWNTEFEEYTADNRVLADLGSGLIAYSGGQHIVETWNKPVYAPQLAGPLYPANWVVRTGDVLGGWVPLWGDSSGHYGFSEAQTASASSLKLFKDGVLVGQETSIASQQPWQFAVPAGNGTYRLEVSAVRGAPATLGTRSTVAWTFASSHVDPSIWTRQPLWSVTLAPPVDATSTAPAGADLTIPLTVAAQPGASVSGLRSVTVAYSTDDGATWANATVTGSGSAYAATVHHPSAAGFVSLRVTALDWAGNSVEETLIRTYRIG